MCMLACAGKARWQVKEGKRATDTAYRVDQKQVAAHLCLCCGYHHWLNCLQLGCQQLLLMQLCIDRLQQQCVRRRRVTGRWRGGSGTVAFTRCIRPVESQRHIILRRCGRLLVPPQL